jgi:hypothetical protein
MATTEQQKQALKAKVAVAILSEDGCTPNEEEVEQLTRLTRIMYKAVLGLHFQRKAQKRNNQLPIF